MGVVEMGYWNNEMQVSAVREELTAGIMGKTNEWDERGGGKCHCRSKSLCSPLHVLDCCHMDAQWW